MNPEKNLDEILDRYITSAKQEEIESHCDQVFERLQTRAGEVDTHARTVRPLRRPLWAAVAAAAMVLAVLIPIAMRPAAAMLEISERKVHFGETVRSQIFGEVVKLEDGSRIEMRTNSELVLERADDGVRIRLDKGDIVVNAAKQHGHLYAQTKDVTVSVVGTVFYVKTESEGSRVVVFEGEVHVKQGRMEKKLGPGDQLASNPKMESIPVQEQVAWSREAVTHIAMLPQTPSPAPQERVAFEVVSIRPSGPAVTSPGARGGGQGLNSRPSPNGCVFDSFGYSYQIDPRRFAVIRATLLHLAAYTIPYRAPGSPERRPDLRCGSLAQMGLLSGGPDWIRADAWDIEAAIPEGTFTRTPALTDPVLQQMLRTMLEERFKLVVRRETREIPVYLLKVGKDGAKFNGQIPLTSDRWGGGQIVRLDPDGKPVPVADLPPPPNGGITTFGGNCPASAPTCGGQLSARNVSMTNLANHLYGLDGRPVLDRTGLIGRYDFHYIGPGVQDQFARIIDMTLLETYGVSGGPGGSLNREAIKAIGLELEEGTAPFDAWVIERVEKPSEN